MKRAVADSNHCTDPLYKLNVAVKSNDQCGMAVNNHSDQCGMVVNNHSDQCVMVVNKSRRQREGDWLVSIELQFRNMY